MITDARVFSTDFVPRDVVHRDAEINHLSSALRPVTEGRPPETACLFGPSGTGKTCIARHTFDKLREQVIDINTQYVNCWENYSRFKTLYRILDGIDQTLDIHRQSTPRDVLLDRLRDYDGQPYLVILDEVDQLEDKGLLYDLYRIPGLSTVLIANEEEELFSQVDDRLASRLQTAVRIRFDKYSVDELVSILHDRVRWGLDTGIVSDEQLHAIARSAAGDARVAIGTLRVAARNARQDGANQIIDEVIEESVSEAKAEVTKQNVEKLTAEQDILYEIITERDEVAPGELYDAYCERSADPKSKRMMRNYLQKMVHYNLIEAEGQNRGRRYKSA